MANQLLEVAPWEEDGAASCEKKIVSSAPKKSRFSFHSIIDKLLCENECCSSDLNDTLSVSSSEESADNGLLDSIYPEPLAEEEEYTEGEYMMFVMMYRQ